MAKASAESHGRLSAKVAERQKWRAHKINTQCPYIDTKHANMLRLQWSLASNSG